MKRCMYWLVLLCCVLLTTTGCQHDPVVYAERIEIVKELPVYCSQLDSSKLVSADEINWETIAFQSEDEVKTYFSEAFLQAYPDYLKVDFSKYTLLVRTYYDFRDYEKREFSLVKNMEEIRIIRLKRLVRLGPVNNHECALLFRFKNSSHLSTVAAELVCVLFKERIDCRNIYNLRIIW